ncbi:D-alanine--D-alanine ligase family protein [Streptomyces bohaiensis]|uniref:D-alanine--D-alanine ligase n=2 Tax=Streptomyces bohaiensis TaxID=1431344 RepID=A0ABX1CBW6_9ACTN|nr:D-alanine--D-alanine ligase [Streptomyces bohaiensis]NJQ16604.1 D-alanine--D-alanine ligase [Streptomyces bohaiensis]
MTASHLATADRSPVLSAAPESPTAVPTAVPAVGAAPRPASRRERPRVAVIGGGRNCEHEVSLATAASIRRALDADRWEVLGLTIGRDGVWHRVTDAGADAPLGEGPADSLAAALTLLADCDLAFPAVHGPLGEDGTLAGLLELAGLPYVGAGVRGGALAMDKWATKLVAVACGLSVAPGRVVTAEEIDRLVWDGPVVVKPVAAGSSHGVTLVRAADRLRPALDAALALDDRVLVEEVVQGREVDIAVLRRADGTLLTGPALEIGVPAGRLFDTGLKYEGAPDFRVPAELPPAALASMERAARQLFAALGCDGVARFDFFVTAEGRLVLNEVNTTPGMTEHSQVPLMFAAVGLPYPRLLDDLLAGADRA